MDPSLGDVPDSIDGLVAVTPTCAAIGPLAEPDGVTRIRLELRTGPLSSHEEALILGWSGQIMTNGQLAVMTVLNEQLISVPSRSETAVQVWVNDLNEPDEILVLAYAG
jgi:hypothetical protein